LRNDGAWANNRSIADTDALQDDCANTNEDIGSNKNLGGIAALRFYNLIRRMIVLVIGHDHPIANQAMVANTDAICNQQMGATSHKHMMSQCNGRGIGCNVQPNIRFQDATITDGNVPGSLDSNTASK
jgi:hypothetical protein